jgi:hypothetical protein
VLGRQARIIHVKTSKGARVIHRHARIIHGKDSTSNTWEGKGNTWDNTWEDVEMF